MQSYNAIATIAQEQGNYVKALDNMQKVAAIARARGDSLWESIARGNTGDIYFLQLKYEKAVPLLESAYKENSRHNLWDQAHKNVLRLATINLEQGNVAVAEKYLLLSEKYLGKMPEIGYLRITDMLKARRDYYMFLSSYYQKKGNTAAALQSFLILDRVKDSLNQQKALLSYSKIRLNTETGMQSARMANLALQAKNAILMRNSVIIILLLLIGFAFFIYNAQAGKRKMAKQIMANEIALEMSEKMRVQEELNHAQEQLIGFTEHISEKNRVIEAFTKEAAGFYKNTGSGKQEEEERMAHFNNLIQSTILTSNEWDEFRTLFEKVHQGFIFRLREKLPNITENEIRLLCIKKLQLTTQETANMLGVSTAAVKKARQRLSKKINMKETETLSEIASHI